MIFAWLGPTDMAAIFVIALLLFGPDQLPKVARQLGEVMRHMQNTTQTFMAEMDRAARETELRPNAEPDEIADSNPSDAADGETQTEEKIAGEPAQSEPPAEEVK